MRAVIGVAAAALFLGAFKVGASEDRLPAMTPQDMADCKAGGGCLVITRAALEQITARRAAEALQACRNLL